MLRSALLFAAVAAFAALLRAGDAALYPYDTASEIDPYRLTESTSLTASFIFGGHSVDTFKRTQRACVGFQSDADTQLAGVTSLPSTGTGSDAPAICPLLASYQERSNLPNDPYRLYLTRLSDSPAKKEIEDDLKSVLAQYHPNVATFALTDLIMYTWVDIIKSDCTDGATCPQNTFQLAIAIADKETYAIFNYDQISFAGFTGLDTKSIAGINVGSGLWFEGLPFSGKDLNVLQLLTSASTVGIAGRYIYLVSTYRPQRLGCFDAATYYSTAGIQPLTLSTYDIDIYGGHRMLVQGPCLASLTQQINCFFSRRLASGALQFTNSPMVTLDNYTGACVSPRSPNVDLGWSTVAVSITGNEVQQFSSSVYVAAPDDDELPLKLGGDKSAWLSANPSPSVLITWSVADFGPVDQSTPLHVLIVGYRETSNVIESMEFEPFYKGNDLKVSSQRYEFKLSDARCQDTRCQGFAIGQVVVRLTIDANNTRASRISLSSRVIPIGWSTYTDTGSQSSLCNSFVSASKPPTFTCPCNVALAKADTRTFIAAPDCNADGSQCWFSSTDYSCFTTLPSSIGAGARCCYNKNGDLAYGQDNGISGGSFSLQYAPVTNEQNFKIANTRATVSYLLSYIVPFASCCLWPSKPSSACVQFGEKSSVGGKCSDYAVSGVAAVIGDPHIATPDGTKITYNNIGEYWLVKPLEDSANATRIQIRLEKFQLPTGSPSATVLTGVVISFSGQKIQIVMAATPTSASRMMNLLYNGKEIVFLKERVQTLGVYHVTASGPTQIMFTVISSNDGPGIQCTYNTNLPSINCDFFLPPSMKSKTSGLLGLWNDVASDDIIALGNTTSVSPDDLSAVHNAGKTWKVAPVTDSIFTYTYKGFSQLNRNLETNTAVFNYTTNTEICNSQSAAAMQSCSYDYSVTSIAPFATSTLNAYNKVVVAQATLGENTTAIYCPFLDIEGAVKTSTAGTGNKVGSKVSVAGCLDGFVFSGSPTTYTCESDATWSSQLPSVSPCTIVSSSGSDFDWILFGIIFGSVVGALLLIALIVFIVRKKQQDKKQHGKKDEEAHDSDNEAKGKGVDNKAKSADSVRDEMEMNEPKQVPPQNSGNKSADYAQQKLYGQSQPQPQVYGQSQPQPQVYGQSQPQVYGQAPQPKVYGQAVVPPQVYGQAPPQPKVYGQMSASPQLNPQAPPVAPRNSNPQAAYGVRVLPPANLPPVPAPTASDSESDSSSDGSDEV